jgi:hypothetical protein
MKRRIRACSWERLIQAKASTRSNINNVLRSELSEALEYLNFRITRGDVGCQAFIWMSGMYLDVRH